MQDPEIAWMNMFQFFLLKRMLAVILMNYTHVWMYTFLFPFSIVFLNSKFQVEIVLMEYVIGELFSVCLSFSISWHKNKTVWIAYSTVNANYISLLRTEVSYFSPLLYLILQCCAVKGKRAVGLVDGNPLFVMNNLVLAGMYGIIWKTKNKTKQTRKQSKI